jgi:hypothetical protein
MADLYKEIIPSILQTKINVLDYPEDYKPFLVNRALSYHVDCVLYANEMNLCHFIDNELQYSYLLNTIRPMKRKFQPWQKSEVIKDIECVKQFFGYSNKKAKDVMHILNDEQLAKIKAKTEKGGVNNDRNTKSS